MSRSPKCSFVWLFLFWLAFGGWALYSYFFGENSLSTYRELSKTRKVLEAERKYWKLKNEMLKEKISAFIKNKEYYYEKLAREMFVKGREGENVILFVK